MCKEKLRPLLAWGIACISIYGIFTFRLIPVTNVIVFLLSFGMAYFVSAALEIRERRIRIYSSVAAFAFAAIELVGANVNGRYHSLFEALHHTYQSLLFFVGNFIAFYTFLVLAFNFFRNIKMGKDKFEIYFLQITKNRLLLQR